MERLSEVPGPALATLSHDTFSDQRWLYERKLDGMRVLAAGSGERVRLRSRSGADASNSFPEVADALAAQATPDFVVDGEVVAFDGDQTSFALLQPRMHVAHLDEGRRRRVEVFYYVFDVLHLDGHSTRGLPLRDRKDLLRELFEWQDPLRFTTHVDAAGETYFQEACTKGWEGVIAKRADAPYRSGRTPDWLKFKCEQGQEFVVGGWTDPQGSRQDFGSLLLGYYADDGTLTYAGKVGTGFDRRTLRAVGKELRARTRTDSAYDVSSLPLGSAWRQGVHWVDPTLVAQVAFAEWTRDGQLRHPRFLGLRTDKTARDVVRETVRPATGSQPRRRR